MNRLPIYLSLAVGAWGAIGVARAQSAQDSLQGSTNAPECKLEGAHPLRVTKISGMPSFFAKVTADGRYMFYIDGGNHILDLDHPERLLRVPGGIDPVPAPPAGRDHRVHVFSAPTGGMSFYSMDDAIHAMDQHQLEQGNMTPVFSDRRNNDDYQSIGVLPGTSERPVYRMLVSGLSIHDYAVGANGQMSVQNSRAVCSNGTAYQLPMISKDGKELAVYDTGSGTTKIMGINDDGTCTEKLDLGFPAGKVEFAYNGKAITFHADTYSVQTGFFSGASHGSTKNVYTLQLIRNGNTLKAGALRKVTANTNKGEASYYPSFSEDGKITYVEGVRNPGTNQVEYSFVTADPNQVPASNLLAGVGRCKVETASSFALGDLWRSICSKFGAQMTATDSALWTLTLDPAACRNLIDQHWAEKKDEIMQQQNILRTNKVTADDLARVTVDSLKAACPGSRGGTNVQTQVGVAQQGASTGTQTPRELFRNRCEGCHNGSPHEGRTYTRFDYDHLSTNEINNMLIAIESGSMPDDLRPADNPHRAEILRPLIDDLNNRRAQLFHEEGAPR